MKKYFMLLSFLFISGCATQEKVVELELPNYSSNYSSNYKYSLAKEDGTIILEQSGKLVNNRIEKLFIKSLDNKLESSITLEVQKNNSQEIYAYINQQHTFKLTNIIHLKNEMADIQFPQHTTVELYNRLRVKPHETVVTKFKSPYANEINKNYLFKLTLD